MSVNEILSSDPSKHNKPTDHQDRQQDVRIPLLQETGDTPVAPKDTPRGLVEAKAL